MPRLGRPRFLWRSEPNCTDFFHKKEEEDSQLSLACLLRIISCCPSGHLLARHHLEARITSQNLVQKFFEAVNVAFDFVVFSMVKRRKTQTLVRIENHCRWEHCRAEELLVCGLDVQVHPHVSQLRPSIAEL